MTKAFVDTTILTDILLKSGDKAKEAKDALNRYERTELPVYAIKEFKKGPLTNHVWLYNKFATLKSYQKVIAALQRMSRTPRRYTTSTALEALETASVPLKALNLEKLQQKYSPKHHWTQFSATISVFSFDVKSKADGADAAP